MIESQVTPANAAHSGGSSSDLIPSALWWDFRIDPIRQGCFSRKKIHKFTSVHKLGAFLKEKVAKCRGMKNSVIWYWWLIAGRFTW